MENVHEKTDSLVALEAPGVTEQPRIRRVANAVLGFAGTMIDRAADFVSPVSFNTGLSEHFGHAEKRNNPAPNIDIRHCR